MAHKIDVPLVQIEGDTVVPVEEASGKEEYAARTLRPKIKERLDRYMNGTKKRGVEHPSLDLDFKGVDLEHSTPEDVLSDLELDETDDENVVLRGGTERAKSELGDFIDSRLDRYTDLSNDPGIDVLSNMSPYLHFGQISPVYVAREVQAADRAGTEDFLEQLIIRWELAINFVFYNGDYDSTARLPEWARETLKEHEDDEREYIYSKEEFEEADTHDPYWNAAQIEMVKTGKMHG